MKLYQVRANSRILVHESQGAVLRALIYISFRVPLVDLRVSDYAYMHFVETIPKKTNSLVI
jgi:hypothetical protein